MNIKELLLDVVHGKSEWSSLVEAGLDIHYVNGPRQRVWKFTSIPRTAIRIDSKDIATGILSLKSSYNKLQDWASFVLAADSLFDFAKIEDSSIGDTLIEALWKLAYSKKHSKTIFQLAEKIQIGNRA